MDSLRQLYTNLGYSDIQSYIQSGNVLFRTVASDTQLLQKTISDKIIETFDWKVPVLVLTSEELKTALENNPFLTDITKDQTYMHLTFLSETPDKTLLDKIPPDLYIPDEFSYSGKTIYLYCPTGYGNTKLNNSFFENKLKLTATTRNLRTTKELLVLAEKI